ncbi:DUF924 domain-containing protein [Jeotgalibaca sp. MA1X17-3]|uniref:DUF924 family protein n=1 Tax=Jeotgalibaca sp. MA1X17-3 TaxID=2908211 RepID=UPI001F1D1E9C|nr:DUF924 family protein [Jeotgalibaca sp. MA1X17-3]UJF15598.1 DUF924 domain-containing protein [Jeotgalibaca sp. MA1X17-3]
MEYQEILDFWFKEIDPKFHFKKDEHFDEEIRQRFSEVHRQAAAGELWQWRETIQGRLAEIIILDQFSRNMFRDQAKAFSTDGIALVLAQEAIRTEEIDKLTTSQRSFLYMPFMHSESMAIHDIAMELFAEKGMENTLQFEIGHRDIIVKFGRFPHRNKALNRDSTPEEVEYMKENKGF